MHITTTNTGIRYVKFCRLCLSMGSSALETTVLGSVYHVIHVTSTYDECFCPDESVVDVAGQCSTIKVSFANGGVEKEQ